MSQKVRITLEQAKDILAADPNGLSDPYCKVEHKGVVKKTKVIKNTLNPKWDDTLEFDFDPAHKITINLYDSDMLSKDDFLGKVDLWPATIKEEPDAWFNLQPAPNSSAKPTGAIKIKVKLV